MKNIFLTGEKGIGKSTALKKAVIATGLKAEGFRSIKEADARCGEGSVHLLDVWKNELPSDSNIVFMCKDKFAPSTADNFNAIGPRTLVHREGAGLVVMDEIGPAEALADRFVSSVMAVLDGPLPVLGVLQKDDYDLYETIKKRSDCLVLTVTADNRDNIVDEIVNALK